MPEDTLNAVEKRLQQAVGNAADWKLWGPYVSERAWGTVREDYSPDGAAWDYFPFEHSHLRAYRWNEDGIAGICDRKQNICFAVSLWNEHDPILKERLFGLSGPKGNHGEDVKEYYYYLDNTPSHCSMKYLYKYPQAAFPYADLYESNASRDKSQREYELIDTGVFNGDRYFDIFIEYAKAGPEDICIKISAINRGPEVAPLHILPTVWFRNTWSWSADAAKPKASETTENSITAIKLEKELQSNYTLYCEGSPDTLFCENETNNRKLFNSDNKSAHTKDGIGNYVVNGNEAAVNPQRTGTKAAAHYRFDIAAGESKEVFLRLTTSALPPGDFTDGCKAVFEQRKADADGFYADIIPANLSDDAKDVMRQSLAGLLWSKQFYHYCRKRMARRRRGMPATAETASFGPEHRMETPL